MRILLIHPKYNSIFSVFDPVKTEPLELEYLGAVAKEENCEYEIYNDFLKSYKLIRTIKKLKPDLVGYSGYVTARDSILKSTKQIKSLFPDIKIIVGGVHAELNIHDFETPTVDFIQHSGGTETFRELIKSDLSFSQCENIKGLSIRTPDSSWVKNTIRPLDLALLPHPDRTYFNKNIQKFRYLNYGKVAMVKSAWGCPYKCNFCYCRLLNEGKYHKRKIIDVVEEISEIETDLVWIIDDTFLIDKKRIIEFAKLIKEKKIKKRFIVYSRADFIANNREFLPILKEIGIIDVIIGLEAVEDYELSSYNKENSALQNELCIKYLNELDINVTALFMMNLDAQIENFRKLDSWIIKMGLKVFTLSIFLPIPGTDLFEQYKDKLTTNDISKWDFLHLVAKPENLSRPRFYYELYRLYLRMILRYPKHILISLPNFRKGNYNDY